MCRGSVYLKLQTLFMRTVKVCWNIDAILILLCRAVSNFHHCILCTCEVLLEQVTSIGLLFAYLSSAIASKALEHLNNMIRLDFKTVQQYVYQYLFTVPA